MWREKHPQTAKGTGSVETVEALQGEYILVHGSPTQLKNVNLADVFSWIPILDTNMAQQGLIVVEHTRSKPIDWLRKLVTGNWLMALKKVGFRVIGRVVKPGPSCRPKK